MIDHCGPDHVAHSGGMPVTGHPHTGLRAVSWLFTGVIEHRDTTGVLVDTGSVSVDGVPAQRGELVHVREGRRELVIEAGPDERTCLLVLGGPPFGE